MNDAIKRPTPVEFKQPSGELRENVNNRIPRMENPPPPPPRTDEGKVWLEYMFRERTIHNTKITELNRTKSKLIFWLVFVSLCLVYSVYLILR